MSNAFLWAVIGFFFLWILSGLNDDEIVRKGTTFILMFISFAMVRIEILFDQLKGGVRNDSNQRSQKKGIR